MGENISHSQISQPSGGQASVAEGASPSNPVTMEEKIIVKWFPGPDMYKAIGLAAKRGISEVKALLLAAGNNPETIENITSITRLVSKMSITQAKPEIESPSNEADENEASMSPP